jgi:Flp pilus assembly protein TadG
MVISSFFKFKDIILNGQISSIKPRFHSTPPPAHNKHRGQAMVELALALPMLMLLIMGAMDFGRAYFIKLTVENAAREGAYYLSYNSDDASSSYAGTIAAIQGEAFSAGVNVESGDITITGCCTVGSNVEVTVNQSIDLFIIDFFTGPLPITGSAKMTVLQ